MKPENSPDLSSSQIELPAPDVANWTEHEHVSEQVQLEAQKLVQLIATWFGEAFNRDSGFGD